MKVENTTVKVKDLVDGYFDNDDDGVVAYGGILDVRPPYQRQFCYNQKEQQEVIDTVLKGFPLNIMYWVRKEDGRYEILDGQQRTLSICHYLDHQFPIELDGKQYYWDSLPDEDYDKLINYDVQVYICEGTNKEKIAWFEVVNKAGEKLTMQELRNASYTGPWLYDAKRHFSKRNCAAASLGGQYISGNPNRQELLEKVLKWISAAQGTTIDEYMTNHQYDEDCSELWVYYQSVINWINVTFPNYRSLMLGIDWGTLYNKYHENIYNPAKLEARISELLQDDDVTSQKGIYSYLLSGDERYLSIRGFDDHTKRMAFERQKGICPVCGREFKKIEDMEADHITPWSKGGKTIPENCQMLCKDCNRRKSDI